MARKSYPSDLTDKQWQVIEPLLPKGKLGGRPASDLREIVNGIFYILKSGAEWRMLPHDLPPWQTVYGYFRRWSQEGVWEKLNQQLVEQERERAKKKPFQRLVWWTVLALRPRR